MARPTFREETAAEDNTEYIVLNAFRSCYLNRWFCKFCIYFSTIDILGPGQHLNTFTAERRDVLGCA